MGINVKHPVKALTNEAFRRLDYRVMAIAFELYNEIGNLWDEEDYQQKLYERCLSAGLDAKKETTVTVSHKTFSKTYFIDLLIEGAVYELKTTPDIVGSHKSQTLNYLFLTNTQHGKIINFRPDSLQWQFVSTTLSVGQRRLYTLHTNDWVPRNQFHTNLPDLVSELLNTWGAYLNLNLYKEALCFFMECPPEKYKKRFIACSPDSIIHITGLSRNKSTYQKNLQKYLKASPHCCIDWINFDRNEVELRTLTKESFCH